MTGTTTDVLPAVVPRWSSCSDVILDDVLREELELPRQYRHLLAREWPQRWPVRLCRLTFQHIVLPFSGGLSHEAVRLLGGLCDRLIAAAAKRALDLLEVRNKQHPRVSQEKLAKILGVTQATVTRMESGDRAITVAELFQIAAALNVSPRWLLSGAFTGEDVPVTSKIKRSPADVRAWLDGETPLPGADDFVFRGENIPADRARSIYGKVRAEYDVDIRTEGSS
jgi:transcriptional regulator with XRE-family HTH domain